ncbi:MAG: hypothetical protein LLG00_06165 [Planctomycetaceae bacterium]|nr:hypothetical protein [Planctomycetaceae bacterium]
MRRAILLVGLSWLGLVADTEASITLLSQQTWADVEAVDIADPTHRVSDDRSGSHYPWAHVSLYNEVGAGGDYLTAWPSTSASSQTVWGGETVTSLDGFIWGSVSGGFPGTPLWQATASASFDVQFLVDSPTLANCQGGQGVSLQNISTGELIPLGSSSATSLLSPGTYELKGEWLLDMLVGPGFHDDIDIRGFVHEVPPPAPEPGGIVIWAVSIGLAVCFTQWRRRGKGQRRWLVQSCGGGENGPHGAAGEETESLGREA